MAWWGSGGILALCQLIHSHQAEVIADLRQKFGVGLWDIPLRELVALVQILHRDPSSWLFASAAGWEFPVSREHLTLMDQFDAFMQANSKKGARPKPYPRPFSDAKRYGGKKKNTPRTPAELEALFASRRGTGG